MSYSYWKHYPALRHALTLGCGIAVARAFDPDPHVLFALLALATSWLVAAIRYRTLLLPAALTVVIAVAGALWYHARLGDAYTPEPGAEIHDAELIGVVIAPPDPREGRLELRLRPDSLLYRNSIAHPAGDVLVRLYDTTLAAETIPDVGERIALHGTARVPDRPNVPGEFDYGAYLASRGIALLFDSWEQGGGMRLGAGDLVPHERLLHAVRDNLRDFAAESVGGEEGGVVRALLLGERAEIEPSTREAFVRTGTVHVLAVSGLHVGILAMLIFVLVSWTANRWVRFGLFSLALVAYALVVGAGPSILRAVVMAVAFMLAYVTGRIVRPLNALGFAGLVLLLFDPAMLFDIGFQLSFASVAGIILFYTPIVNRLGERFPRLMRDSVIGKSLVQMILLSASAQLLTFPLTLYYFGYVSLVAPLVNIAVVPLTSAGLAASVAGALVQWSPPLADAFGGAAHLTVRCALAIVEWFNTFEWIGADVASVGWIGAGLMMAGVLYLGMSKVPGQAIVRSAALLLLIALVLRTADMFDPLVGTNGAEIFLVPASSSGGIAVAVRDENEIAMYYHGAHPRDSVGASYSARTIARRCGIPNVRLVDLARIETMGKGEQGVIRLGDRFPEYVLTGHPVILSNTSRRGLRVVSLGSDRILQVPLRGTIERTIALADVPYGREIEWR